MPGVIQVPSCPSRGAAAQASITARNARVEAQLEAPAAQRAQQPPRDAQLRRAEHGARVGGVPEDGRAAVPRKDAEGVGEQQPLGTQVAPRGQEARPARPRAGRGRPAPRSAGRRALARSYRVAGPRRIVCVPIDGSIEGAPRMNFDFSEDQKFVQKTRARLPRGALRPRRLSRGPRVATQAYDPNALEGRRGDGLARRGRARELRRRRPRLPRARADRRGDRPRARADPVLARSVYLATEAILRYGSDEQKKKYLPRLASGELIGTFAVAEGAGDLDGGDASRRASPSGKLNGTKLPVLDGDVAGLAVVGSRRARAARASRSSSSAAPGVDADALKSFDPSALDREARVRGRAGRAARREAEAARQLATALLDRAAVMMAFEQIGGADARPRDHARVHARTATRSAGRSRRSRR